MNRKLTITALAVVLTLTGALGAFAFGGFGPWGAAVDIETFGAGAHENFNTSSLDGCPFISPDGKMFFMASNRPGSIPTTEGGPPSLDIWVSTRASAAEPWGEPVHLGPPINTKYRDFCPTIGRDGKTFFFASDRPEWPEGVATCGEADLYMTRFDSNFEVKTVTHLGCEDDGGVNSSREEHSPFPAEIPGEGKVLFYSSTRPLFMGDLIIDHDLYTSPWHDGVYGKGTAIPGVNTQKNEGQPNVRRDGLEMFFWSDRLDDPATLGAGDIYSVSKGSPQGDWGMLTNLGSGVNSPFPESRPSLSWDGTTLYFGSTRAGSSDIYVTTR